MEASGTTGPGISGALASAPAQDWLRMLGGVVFAVGAFVLFIRKSGSVGGGSNWADFPLLLVVATPCALLFWLGVTGRTGANDLEPWRSVLMVTGVLLAPVALSQLRNTLGLSEASSFWTFLIFAITAAMAGYASFVVGAAYQALLAALAGIAAWLSLWAWIASPSATGFRWLLIVLGVVYLGAAAALRSSDAPQAPEIVTATGIVGVLVGTIGVLDAGVRLLGGGLLSGAFGGQPPGGQGVFWDIVLLLVSLALIAYGALVRARGPSYIGAIGLLLFVIFVGVEVNTLLEGDQPDGSFVGWPLVLLLLGAGALAAGLAPRPGAR
jgi:hypothetical protein